VGGVVGITGRGPCSTWHRIRPEFATASVDGKYVIEGHGVDPDIVVENDPADVIAGRDPQLDEASPKF